MSVLKALKSTVKKLLRTKKPINILQADSRRYAPTIRNGTHLGIYIYFKHLSEQAITCTSFLIKLRYDIRRMGFLSFTYITIQSSYFTSRASISAGSAT